MLRSFIARVALTCTVASAIGPVAFAQQPLGTFRWQLTPFCNVITVAVTQHGGTFTLDGFDDQCGAATRAAVVGTAFPNPNGSIGVGLSIVATPGAAPVHVDVALNVATVGGPWRDSAGNTGTFQFNPSSPAPGGQRPATGGLISTVTPGAGLVGGGTTGAVSLAVHYGGTGFSQTVARSDHTHATAGMNNTGVGVATLFVNALGADNTAMGSRALDVLSTGNFNSGFGADALGGLTIGERNTAVGSGALFSVDSSDSSTAVGTFALFTSTGTGQTAVGAGALESNATGTFNTAIGLNALRTATGSRNVSLGREALGTVQAGNDNVAVGHLAGSILTTGSANVYIAHVGAVSENGSIRIGTTGTQDSTFIAGIAGQSVNGISDQPVLVDATGKLGTTTSSARFKQDIHPLGDRSTAILRLEPVSFRYTAEQNRGSALQYGLIAEQVAEVMPDLVIHDEDGRPFTVKYHLLPTLLLAEIQRLERERAIQAKEIQALREELQTLLQQRR